MLVGPVVVTKSDGEGEFVSLSRKDIAKITDRVELGRLALGLPI